jgi:hypothetical protein
MRCRPLVGRGCEARPTPLALLHFRPRWLPQVERAKTNGNHSSIAQFSFSETCISEEAISPCKSKYSMPCSQRA